MPKKKPDFYRAKESFVTMFEGEQISVAAGEFVRAGHSLLKRREDHFEPVESFGRFDVEQATKAPGEKRAYRRKVAKPAEVQKAAAPSEKPGR
jgi:hypothetical protein